MLDSVWSVSLIALWGVVLINLFLTIRVIGFMRAMDDRRTLQENWESIPELPVGEPAPDFKARTISGDTVRLADFSGHPTAFIFVSPACAKCRQEAPDLLRLGPGARERTGTELVLVSDQSTASTRDWINGICEEDHVEVTLKVVAVPGETSDLLAKYNPRGLHPSFCYLDEAGVVRARGPVGASEEWFGLYQQWKGAPVSPRRPRPSARYR